MIGCLDTVNSVSTFEHPLDYRRMERFLLPAGRFGIALSGVVTW
jgi:hypothetical protein